MEFSKKFSSNLFNVILRQKLAKGQNTANSKSIVFIETTRQAKLISDPASVGAEYKAYLHTFFELFVLPSHYGLLLDSLDAFIDSVSKNPHLKNCIIPKENTG